MNVARPDTTTGDSLAAALCGAPLVLTPAVLAAVAYHGIGPLLLSRSGAAALMPEARARAMWELRHRALLARLLAAFAAGGVAVLVIKGTALAYDLYPDPALRPRGDTDLLILPAARVQARAILAAQGFRRASGHDSPPGALQEGWVHVPADGGPAHEIDLHWQAFNSPALGPALPVEEALAEAVPLPRLAPEARALSRPHGLLHACLHRAKHIHSPYFSAGKAHYGGDRLIWLCDIDLLARALTPEAWESFTTRATARGAAPVCAAALGDAERLFATPLPARAMARLHAARPGAATLYLQSATRRRALADLRASGPQSRRAYLRSRLFPPASALRSQYPRSRLPVPLLWLRRLLRFAGGGRL